MGKARYLVLCIALVLLVSAGPSFAKGLQAASDGELDGISARGLDLLFDANSFMNGGFNGRSYDGVGPANLTFQGINNLTLRNSIMLSGQAQQNGLGIVNAVNSSVNMPINITILINSQVGGGINFTNFLSALGR
jgi:hypothetical protein